MGAPPSLEKSETDDSQVSRYEKITHECSEAIKTAGDDRLLIVDCYYLQAVALYRLHRPLDAVNAFNHGKRFYARYQEELPTSGGPEINDDYEQVYASLF